MALNEDLELQYSPSRWSKRYSADEIVEKHIEFCVKASNLVKKNIPCLLNIPYGKMEDEKLDIFGTDLADDAPIFIYIHGGYWQQLSRDISCYVVPPLYSNGFKVIVIGYALCPKVTLKHITEQMQKALLKCIEYAHSKGSKNISLCGHSAGAHLVASLCQDSFSYLSAETKNILKAIYLISGIYNLIPITKTYINNALKLDETTAKALSPLYQNFANITNMKIFIICAENDSPAFHEQSKLYNEKLKHLGCMSQLVVIKDVDHYSVVENLNEISYELIALIKNIKDY